MEKIETARKKFLYAVISLVLLVVIAYYDYVTGYDFTFFVFYYIPIFLVLWYVGVLWAIILSFMEAVIWFNVDRFTGHPYSNWIFPYWNAFVRWSSFLIFVAAVYQIKKEKKLKEELSIALKRVTQMMAVARKIAEGDLTLNLQAIRGESRDSFDETLDFMVKKLLEQKELESRLHTLEKQAIMAEIAAHLAHEIRNPLNLIVLTAHHLGTKFAPREEKLRKEHEELLLSLKTEVEHLNKMVAGFLSIGQPGRLIKGHFFLLPLVEQLQALVKQRLAEKRIRFQPAVPQDFALLGDMEQLRLLLLNIIINAIKTQATSKLAVC